VIKHFKLPDKTNQSLRHHLRGEGSTDDVVALISTLKLDTFLITNGNLVLMADMVSMFIDTGMLIFDYKQ